MPTVGDGCGPPPPLLQPPAPREDHPPAGGSQRRRHGHPRSVGGSGARGSPDRSGRCARRLGRGDHHRLAGFGGRSLRHRRPRPGQFRAVAGAGGVHGVRDPVQYASGGQRAGSYGHPYRLRLPADRCGPRPHPEGGRPGHDPATFPGHRPDGGGHADEGTGHVRRGHPPSRRPPVRSRRPETAGLCGRPGHRGAGDGSVHHRRAAGHQGRDRAQRHHGRSRHLPTGGRSFDPQ